MMARAHQMVDMLAEENRMLRQEMEACREKVTKLHKVTSPAEELQRIGFNFIYLLSQSAFLNNTDMPKCPGLLIAVIVQRDPF